MITMTSLQAQNRFGEMIDTSQREPVIITRRGRPVSVVLSPSGSPKKMHIEFMRVMSALYPLRGEEAITEFDRLSAPIGQRAKALGLTEEKLAAVLDADTDADAARHTEA